MKTYIFPKFLCAAIIAVGVSSAVQAAPSTLEFGGAVTGIGAVDVSWSATVTRANGTARVIGETRRISFGATAYLSAGQTIGNPVGDCSILLINSAVCNIGFDYISYNPYSAVGAIDRSTKAAIGNVTFINTSDIASDGTPLPDSYIYDPELDDFRAVFGEFYYYLVPLFSVDLATQALSIRGDIIRPVYIYLGSLSGSPFPTGDPVTRSYFTTTLAYSRGGVYIPEPASISLLGLGIAGLAWRRRKLA